MSDPILDALGDIPEYGGSQRIVLPDSFYPVTLDVEEVDVSPVSDEEYIEDLTDVSGEPVKRGGTPYVQMGLMVGDGPFEGNSFSSRFYLSPGKGKNIGFVNHAAKAISGQPVNKAALEQFGFTFEPGMSNTDVQRVFRVYFYSLEPALRLEFMTLWCNVNAWDGKGVIAKVGHDDVERTNDIGEDYVVTFNRIQGFSSLKDARKGLAWVRKTCFPKQEVVARELGLISE